MGGAEQGRVGLLGLGSHVGERRTQLQRAVAALTGAGVEVLASSSTYDTDPVGEVPDQASFLNACLLVRTPLAPLELLDTVVLSFLIGNNDAHGKNYSLLYLPDSPKAKLAPAYDLLSTVVYPGLSR